MIKVQSENPVLQISSKRETFSIARNFNQNMLN